MEPPTLPAASLAFARAEDDARVDGGVAVGALDARDPDVGQTATLSYSLSGADAAHFEVTAAARLETSGGGGATTTTYELRSVGALDYEARASYDLVVTVTDADGLAASASVVVTVVDVNDLAVTSIRLLGDDGALGDDDGDGDGGEDDDAAGFATAGGDRVVIRGANFGWASSASDDDGGGVTVRAAWTPRGRARPVNYSVVR